MRRVVLTIVVLVGLMWPVATLRAQGLPTTYQLGTPTASTYGAQPAVPVTLPQPSVAPTPGVIGPGFPAPEQVPPPPATVPPYGPLPGATQAAPPFTGLPHTTLPNAYVVGSDPMMNVLWDHGLVFQTAERDVRFRLGGALQMDAGWFLAADDIRPAAGTPGTLLVDPRDSVSLRRARIRFDATVYDNIDFAAEFDLATTVTSASYLGQPPGQPAVTNSPTPTDLFVQLRELPLLQNFRLGNFREPIGLEHLTSGRWQPFMERSFAMDAFYGPFNNGFSPGAMIFGTSPRQQMTYAFWIGPNTSNPFGYHVGAAQYAVTERVTFLPYYDADGRYLWHLGGTFSFRVPDDQQVQIRSRGEIRNGPPGPLNTVYAQTGSLLADSQELINIENAIVAGPWTLQAEYAVSFLNGVASNPLAPPVPEQQALNGGRVITHGGYLELMYFLTGEHTPYDRSSGTFSRQLPVQNAYWVRTACGNAFSRGAWQLAARYSGLNLNDSGLNGGILNSMTLGVNWYVNPYLKYQFNYDLTDRSAVAQTPSGKINSFGLRMALDF